MIKDMRDTITGLINGKAFSLDLAPITDGVLSVAQINAQSFHCHPSVKIELAAQIAHEINRAYCAFLGDGSQESWEKAPEWQRDSAIEGMRAHFANPNMTARDSHIAWCEHKFAEGWRYGPVKDADAKEHPCMVPYRELPKEQRLKDHLFKAVADAVRDTPL